MCGDRFIQGTALAQHRRMQGHYEETNQPAPFASISVNNPNRFTNANRVNRVGLAPSNGNATATSTAIKTETSDSPVKPVISLSISSNGVITTQSISDMVLTTTTQSVAGNGNVNSLSVSNIESSDDLTATITTQSAISPFIVSPTPVGSNFISASRFLTSTTSSANTTQPSEITTLFSLSYNQGY